MVDIGAIGDSIWLAVEEVFGIMSGWVLAESAAILAMLCNWLQFGQQFRALSPDQWIWNTGTPTCGSYCLLGSRVVYSMCKVLLSWWLTPIIDVKWIQLLAAIRPPHAYIRDDTNCSRVPPVPSRLTPLPASLHMSDFENEPLSVGWKRPTVQSGPCKKLFEESLALKCQLTLTSGISSGVALTLWSTMENILGLLCMPCATLACWSTAPSPILLKWRRTLTNFFPASKFCF